MLALLIELNLIGTKEAEAAGSQKPVKRKVDEVGMSYNLASMTDLIDRHTVLEKVYSPIIVQLLKFRQIS